MNAPRTTGESAPARGALALVLVASRLVVGAVFLYAAATKVVDLPTFAEEVANYQLLGPRLVAPAAVSTVGVEIVCGLLLVLGLRARAAAALVAGMLALFIFALSQSLLRGIDLRCGCFGGAESATWSTVIRDVALLVPTALVLLRGAGAAALDGLLARGRA